MKQYRSNKEVRLGHGPAAQASLSGIPSARRILSILLCLCLLLSLTPTTALAEDEPSGEITNSTESTTDPTDEGGEGGENGENGESGTDEGNGTDEGGESGTDEGGENGTDEGGESGTDEGNGTDEGGETGESGESGEGSDDNSTDDNAADDNSTADNAADNAAAGIVPNEEAGIAMISNEVEDGVEDEVKTAPACDTTTWTKWIAGDSLPNAAGSYYLTKNVELSSPWIVPDGTVNLCLHGRTISLKNGGHIEILSSDTTFDLLDNEDNTGKITGGTNDRGGAVFCSGGTFNMYGGSITENTATTTQHEAFYGSGGGVYCTKGAFNMYGGSITNNTAKLNETYDNDVDNVNYNQEVTANGGGVFCDSSTFNLSGGEISNNQTAVYTDNQTGRLGSNNGGGVYCYNSTLKMSDGSITGNKASYTRLNNFGRASNYDGSGGGVYCIGSTFELSGGTISNNTTELIGNMGGMALGFGGGIYCNTSTFTLSGNAEISGNESKYGGGVYVCKVSNMGITALTVSSDTAKFEMTDGIITKNTAKNYGGGLYLSGCSAVISGGVISENNVTSGNTSDTTTYGGGGIYTGSGSIEICGNAAITKNSADCGGGIYSKSITKVYGKATISENEYRGKGGGIFSKSGDIEIYEDAVISKNTIADKDSYDGGKGGGVYVEDGDVKIYGKAAISENNFGKNGVLNGILKGGGVYITGGNLTLSGNAAITRNVAANGGGVYMAKKGGSVGKYTMTGGTVSNNTADVDGGGIYLDSGTVTINEDSSKSLISGNTATTGNGGGVYLGGGTFTMTGGAISDNTAENWTTLNSENSGNGGGVYLCKGAPTLTGGTITGNTCSRFGGGIRVYQADKTTTASATLTGGQITSNKAGQAGGGLMATGTKVTVNNSVQITGNQAVNGGGLYLQNGADLTMTGGKISDNRAVSLKSGSLPDFFTTIRDTTLPTSLLADDGNGGGVYILNAVMNLEATVDEGNIVSKGTIYNNTADGNGGGLYLEQSSGGVLTVNITDGDIMDNTAGIHGGGIAMYAENNDKANADISGSALISNNTAVNGGGFYVGGGTLTVQGGVMRYNKAVGMPDASVTTAADPNDNKGVGGGIYAYDTGTLELKVREGGYIGVYDNKADFAANDVYCSPQSASVTILSTKYIQDEGLKDLSGHEIGKASDWIADYPAGDTQYDGSTSYASGNKWNFGRCDDAKEGDARVTVDDKALQGYTCLSLNFYYSRVTVTVTNTVVGTDTKDDFDFTVTILGHVASEDQKDDTPLIYGWTSTSAGEEYTVDNSGTPNEGGKDKNGDYTAVLHFSLKDGEYVVLEGVPVNSYIKIQEQENDYYTAFNENNGTGLMEGYKIATIQNPEARKVDFYNSPTKAILMAQMNKAELDMVDPDEPNDVEVHFCDKGTVFDPVTLKTLGDNFGSARSKYFAAWYSEEELTNEIIGSLTLAENGTIVYAKWVPHVTFDANGGSFGTNQDGTSITTTDKAYDSTSTIDFSDLSVCTIPTRVGYTFTGWYADKEAKQRLGSGVEVSQAMTAYAGWVQDGTGTGGDSGEQVTLTLVYDQAWHNYHSLIGIGDTPDVVMYFPVGTEINMKTLVVPGHEGETPVQWYEDEMWNKRVDTFVMNADKTLYAPGTLSGGGGVLGGPSPTWNTLTYETNGGTMPSGKAGTSYSASYESTETVDLTQKNQLPTKTGYTFGGWYDNPSLSGSSLTEIKMDSNKTIYAKWLATLTLVYDQAWKQVRTGTPDVEIAIETGTDVNLSTLVINGHDNQATIKWYEDAGFQNLITAPFAMTANKTVYAGATQSGDVTPAPDPIPDPAPDPTPSTPSGGGGGGGDSKTETIETVILHYASNGGTEYPDEEYTKGTTVTISKVPGRTGYRFNGWFADETLTQPITDVIMSADKVVYAGWVVSTVPESLNGDDHFAYIIGYSDGTVRPMNNISRAEVGVIFFRLLKADVRDSNLTTTNSFQDVQEGMWCNTALSTMKKLGLVLGKTDTYFNVNAPITRAEFATICARFDKNTVVTARSNLTDIDDHWAKAYIERAVALGWIQGYSDGTFRPDQYITRAQAMTIINRMLCRIPETEEDLLDDRKRWSDNLESASYYLAVNEATNSHVSRQKGEVYEAWTSLNTDPDWSRYQ